VITEIKNYNVINEMQLYTGTFYNKLQISLIRLVLLCIILASCNKEELTKPKFSFELDSVNCIDETLILDTSRNEYFEDYYSDKDCYDYLGTFKLSDTLKHFFPYACMNIDECIEFKNNHEEIQIYQLSSLKIRRNTTWVDLGFDCNSNSNSIIHHVYEREKISCQLRDPFNENKFILYSIHNYVKRDSIGIPAYYQHIDFTQYNDSISIDRSVLEVDQFQENENLLNLYSIGQIELNGITFSNVCLINSYQNNLKYYLNPEFGLVGFEDINGNTYSLNLN